MTFRFCDCCAKRGATTRVLVGAKKQKWFVCVNCKTKVVPRIPESTEVPLLNVLVGFLNNMQPPKRRE